MFPMFGVFAVNKNISYIIIQPEKHTEVQLLVSVGLLHQLRLHAATTNCREEIRLDLQAKPRAKKKSMLLLLVSHPALNPL